MGERLNGIQEVRGSIPLASIRGRAEDQDRGLREGLGTVSALLWCSPSLSLRAE